jgi:hypothetical protein
MTGVNSTVFSRCCNEAVVLKNLEGDAMVAAIVSVIAVVAGGLIAGVFIVALMEIEDRF